MIYTQSNETVFVGHPDRICNQIGAAILREAMSKDKATRAGIEVCGGKGKIFVTGEMRTRADIDVDAITRKVLTACGVNSVQYVIENNIGMQSADIALGVDKGGAGDQGDIFGAACNDNEFWLPDAQMILQDFVMKYYDMQMKNPDSLYPDGKAQITGEYDGRSRRLVKIKKVVISYQNAEEGAEFRKRWDKEVRRTFQEIAESYGYKVGDNAFLINPTGKFKIGGFDGDAGVLGRKLVVDGYQGFFRTSGGAAAGKDASKVDFSAAMKSRALAKRVVFDGAKWAEVQLSYCIGKKHPTGIMVLTDTGYKEVPEEWYEECEPARMIKDLRLNDMDFVQLARFGNFGRYEKEYFRGMRC